MRLLRRGAAGRAVLDRVAARLRESEEIAGEEVVALIEGPQPGIRELEKKVTGATFTRPPVAEGAPPFEHTPPSDAAPAAADPRPSRQDEESSSERGH
jgi:hypothetical protein